MDNCPRCGFRLTDLNEPTLFEALAETEAEAAAAADSVEPTLRPVAVAVDQLAFDVAPEKPIYRIPLMEEIRQVEPNGLRVLSTFSGCGGSCLGFKMAGFSTVAAAEFVPAAVETYEANFPGIPVLVQNIRDVEPALILERFGIERGELDVLEGSPPCSSFSTAGKREEGWGQVKKYSDVSQRTDDLFDEYVRLVAGLRPKVFVAENVPGFLYGAADHFRRWVEGMLSDLGYIVWHQVLDAARFGVPQRRKRVIIIGVRRDLGIHPADLYPEPLLYSYSVRDALPWLDGRIVADRRTSTHSVEDYFEQPLDEPIPTITANGVASDVSSDWQIYAPTAEQLEEASIERYAIGDAWDELNGYGQSERYFSLVRPDPDEPLPTVTQTGGNLGAASVVHPTEKRKFTIPELRRLCGFPDDFVLTGSYGQQWERLGRAVPPPLMYAVAARIRDALLAQRGPR